MTADALRGTGTLPVTFCAWLLLVVRPALAVEIPPRERVIARTVQTLAASADQPLNMPTDVAVDRAERVYIADGVNDRIVRLRPDGSLDAVIREAAGRALNRPVGLFVDAADRLWIADTGNGRIVSVEFPSPEPGPAPEVGSQRSEVNVGRSEAINLPEPETGGVPDLTDVALSADGARVYVVDNDAHRVLVRDSEGKWTRLGASGRSLGQLEWPFMIAVSPSGEAYVSEAVGARVQRLSADFQWAGTIARWGVERGQLYRPKGVALDAAGRLFVSDSTLGVVQVFDRRGGLVGVLTEDGGAALRFDHPMGMCFDGEGRLYVVELKPGRVAVIELREKFAP